MSRTACLLAVTAATSVRGQSVAPPTHRVALTTELSERLDQSFERWWREYERGSIAADNLERTRKRPLLHPSLRSRRSSYDRPYDRRAEGVELAGWLLHRATLADGERIVRILRHDWPKHRAAERLRGFRAAITDLLRRGDCPSTIQGAVLDAIRAGEHNHAVAGSALALRHSEPEFAARVVPLLGRFHASRFRSLLLAYCRGGQRGVASRAAETLARTEARGAVAAIAVAVGKLDHSVPGSPDPALRDDWRRLVSAARTCRQARASRTKSAKAKPATAQPATTKPAGADALVDATLTRIAEEKWLNTTELLVPVLLDFRRARSIPVLIEALARGLALGREPRHPTRLPFQLAIVHDALQDLTGHLAPADAPQRWREFWAGAKDGFVVPPPKPRVSKQTSAGFYGIPIRGRRVLFVLDRSGSMANPIVVASTGTRASPSTVQRIDQAKAELLSAVGRLPEKAKFKVLVFGDSVISVARMTSGPRALESLRTRLQRIRPTGGTQLLAALRQGLRGAVHAFSGSPSSVDEVFVLSDGAPASPPSEILRAVREWNAGGVARIHTVFLGGGPPIGGAAGGVFDARGEDSPAAFMQRLAEQNGGQFRQVR